MKLVLKVLTLAVISFLIAGQLTAKAQGFGGGAGGYNNPNSVRGTVSAIDTTGNTITVTGRDGTATTVKVNADTKYTKMTVVPVSTIAVGNFVSVMNYQGIDPTAISIRAQRITILDKLPPVNPNPPATTRQVNGTVLTITPGLTIKSDSGTTLNIVPDDTTQVYQTVPAALTDVAVGNNVQITTSTTDATTATAVHIVPARQRRPANQ